MARESHEQFEPGGPIILRSQSGDVAYVFPPFELGNYVEASTIVPELLTELSHHFGAFEERKASDDPEPYAMGQWWEWEEYTSAHYYLERRSYVTNVGASGAVEQLIIGVLAAVSYDLLKTLTMAIARSVRKSIGEYGRYEVEGDTAERIERALTHAKAKSPIELERIVKEGEERWEAIDAKGHGFSIRIDGDGILFVVPGKTVT